MEEYLKTLLEQIRCKKAWPYIRRELQEHIEDQIAENMHAGMDYEQAEKEAVRDMGDPVETGISLDRIHKPQIAWKLLLMVMLISAVGVLIHIMIARHMGEEYVSASGKYVFHVITGIAVMLLLYFLDYTLLAGHSRMIATVLLAVCFFAAFFGYPVNGMRYYISIGGRPLSIQAFMLFYVPVYGGILYQYHGSGYKGFMKAVAWMLLPVILVLRLPALMTAGLMLISMLVMLTMAIWKGWFTVHRKRALCVLWGSFTVLPAAALLIMYSGNRLRLYQKERIQAVISGDGYLTSELRDLLAANKFVGNSGTAVTEILPDFNRDFILAYLSSSYGMLAAILICCILAALIFAVFNTALRQKNQLGMVMGCGCGMVFLVSFLINVSENLGIFPATSSFLPFLSAGGSYTVAVYGLMGIVLSIYRYKNIYPCHAERVKKTRMTGQNI